MSDGWVDIHYSDQKIYTSLIEKGFAPERIKKYGFAFEGKKVLIG